MTKKNISWFMNIFYYNITILYIIKIFIELYNYDKIFFLNSVCLRQWTILSNNNNNKPTKENLLLQ